MLFLFLFVAENKRMRIGFGFDVHQLAEGRELRLGGITIPHVKGALGHSDADVLIHAICDALLGAQTWAT
jgi:2-C-methyl-D-erythritol 2,4-cyclodiphosphate synthase